MHDKFPDKVDSATINMRTRKPTPVIISNDEHEIKIYTTESHGRALYQLSFYRGGKRERRSFSDLNEAKREARIILGGIARDQIQAENLTAAEIESYTIARRTLAPFNMPVHVASELFASVQRELPPSVSLLEAVRYWNRYNHDIRQNTVSELRGEFIAGLQSTGVTRSYVVELNRCLDEFGKFTAGRMLSSLRGCDLDAWLRQLPWEPSTKNGARRKITIFAKWARRSGYLPKDFNEFEDAMKFQEPVTEVTTFTPDEMKRLLNVSGRHLITPYLSIGGFAGLRSAEITRLDWKNVNFDRGFIEVRADTCKTRARRLVPISDNLRAWLKPFALQSGPVVPYGNANCVVARVASHAGIKWKKNALRHSFVSYRLAATNDGARTALEAGHNQKVLFRVYREVVSPEVAAQWFQIMPPLEMERGMVGISRYKRNRCQLGAFVVLPKPEKVAA